MKKKPVTSTITTATTSVDGAQAITPIESVVLETPVVGARPKTQQHIWSSERTLPSGDSWRLEAVQHKKSSSKSAEAEFLLTTSHESRSPDRRGAKRVAPLEESGEWKYLTAIQSQSVECLREKSEGLDVGSKVTCHLLTIKRDDKHLRHRPQSRRSPSPIIRARAASLRPRPPALTSSPVGRRSPEHRQ